MDTWTAISSRRQVREFTDSPLEDEHLHQVLDGGRFAASGMNNQPWDFVVVTDRSQLENLSAVWKGAHWIVGAPAVVALVLPNADNEGTRLMNRFDLGQAAGQMMLVATSIGVGSGIAGCRDQNLAREVLGLPDDRYCALLLALGDPADGPIAPVTLNRRAFDDVVHFGSW